MQASSFDPALMDQEIGEGKSMHEAQHQGLQSESLKSVRATLSSFLAS